ncbi:MAG TPA: MarR family transcriptional regulator [Gaiellaceae bacterium]|jgi:DNA-binding MarR family transcriptional regulator
MARVPLERVIRIAAFRSQLRSFLRHSERRCLSLGLTPQRFVLLLLIDGAPDGSRRASFTDLAARLELERNTVTELCARAEEAGLIAREGSAVDKRVVYLRLTKDGDRLLQRALAETDDVRRELLEAFELLADAFRTA